MRTTYKILTASLVIAAIAALAAGRNVRASAISAATVEITDTQFQLLEGRVKLLENADETSRRNHDALAAELRRRVSDLGTDLSAAKIDLRAQLSSLKSQVGELSELAKQVETLSKANADLKASLDKALSRLAHTDDNGNVTLPHSTGRLVITNSSNAELSVLVNGVRFMAAVGPTHLWVPLGKTYIQIGDAVPVVRDNWEFDATNKSYLMKVSN